MMKSSNSDDKTDFAAQIRAALPPDYEEKRLAAIAQEEATHREAAIQKLIERACLPERHANIFPENSGPWWDAWQKVESRLGTGCIIPIIGTRGSGKTQLAVNAVRHVCGKGANALYTKAMAIFLDIREAMSDRDKSEKEAIKRFISQKLLVIDAMEVRGETDFENRILDYVIDLRYDAGLDTILISNLKKDDFTKSLGPSIVSRVHESGELIECVWTSYREPKPDLNPKRFDRWRASNKPEYKDPDEYDLEAERNA